MIIYDNENFIIDIYKTFRCIYFMKTNKKVFSMSLTEEKYNKVLAEAKKSDLSVQSYIKMVLFQDNLREEVA